jgi:hypothetical protein
MKSLFLTLLLLSGFVFVNESAAIQPSLPAEGHALALAQQLTVNDFLSFDAKSYRTAEGKKLKWTQRMAFQVMQKNLARKVKKGKIAGDMTMDEAAGAAGGNLYGLLSLIFAVVGLFIPYLGLAMLIAALVLGIIGLKRDNNPTMATIGLVLSAIFLLLIIIVIAVASSTFWF